MDQVQQVADPLIVVDRGPLLGRQRPGPGFLGEDVHSLAVARLEVDLENGRAAAEERPWRSGRMSRDRIAKSLSGSVVTVAIAVTLAESFVSVYLILSRELFLRKAETERERRWTRCSPLWSSCLGDRGGERKPREQWCSTPCNANLPCIF